MLQCQETFLLLSSALILRNGKSSGEPAVYLMVSLVAELLFSPGCGSSWDINRERVPVSPLTSPAACLWLAFTVPFLHLSIHQDSTKTPCTNLLPESLPLTGCTCIWFCLGTCIWDLFLYEGQEEPRETAWLKFSFISPHPCKQNRISYASILL